MPTAYPGIDTSGFRRGVTSTDKIFSFTADVSLLEFKVARHIRHRLPKFTSIALTLAAKDVQRNLKNQILARYDRPTRWTQNSTFVDPATPSKLVTAIYFKDEAPKGTPAGRYLKPTVFGTRRRHKVFERRLIDAGVMDRNEFAVPGGGVRLNRFGNITPGQIQKILSQLGAQRDAYQNTTARSTRRAGSQRARLFVAPHGSHLARGIYEVRGKKIKPIMIFTTDTPNYAVILPFKRIAQRRFDRRFPIRFRQEVKKTLAFRRR